MPAPSRPLFLFDGDCGVCQNGTDDMQRRMRPPVDFLAYQRADLDALGVDPADLERGPVLVRADGTSAVGADAVIDVLRSAGRPYRNVGRILALPGVRSGVRRLGAVAYRNRHRAPGAAGSCAVPTAD